MTERKALPTEPFTDYQVVRDCEIIRHMPKGFGEGIDNNVNMQRKTLLKGVIDKYRGFWNGHTLFHTMVDMGLVENNKPSSETKLTARGLLFLRQEHNQQL